MGFLPRHLLKHKTAYNGKLAQIIEFVADSDSPVDSAKLHLCYGLCRAVLVEAEPEEDEENGPTSSHVHDDDEMDDKEEKQNKKDNQTYHTPTKTGSPTRKKRKISSV